MSPNLRQGTLNQQDVGDGRILAVADRLGTDAQDYQSGLMLRSLQGT